MILVLNNRDSFVFNLARYLTCEGANVSVVDSDRISLDEIAELAPQALVLSPGPCTPNEAGICLEAVRHFAGKLPILGVCLGHQCIGASFGGRISRARRPMHGLASDISHTGERLFAGLPQPLPDEGASSPASKRHGERVRVVRRPAHEREAPRQRRQRQVPAEGFYGPVQQVREGEAGGRVREQPQASRRRQHRGTAQRGGGRRGGVGLLAPSAVPVGVRRLRDGRGRGASPRLATGGLPQRAQQRVRRRRGKQDGGDMFSAHRKKRMSCL